MFNLQSGEGRQNQYMMSDDSSSCISFLLSLSYTDNTPHTHTHPHFTQTHTLTHTHTHTRHDQPQPFLGQVISAEAFPPRGHLRPGVVGVVGVPKRPRRRRTASQAAGRDLPSRSPQPPLPPYLTPPRRWARSPRYGPLNTRH